ncbi:GNAT family acetyltransferase [Pedobacter lusitanus]|uniref:GNAT family acetyltransferase n=1 Tax=Pedobacter lusitanus TaxID=1503925 RepID=A0A0D0GI91_9SPHI|nr:GNAT family N-acetyltransferase [Pedobacter lusitanus]KIO75820.1 GNAT family acetyltransferase [Pedobacter lusitanus]
MVKVISVRETPEYKDRAIAYLQEIWEEVPPVIYEDCVNHSINAGGDLPQWYLLENGGEIIGCAGLVPNDFISRMDLYPWVCAVYVDEKYRGHAYGSLLLEKAKQDTKKAGFRHMYLCTDHVGYYEKYGFSYIGQGYHPWEEESRIYGVEV